MSNEIATIDTAAAAINATVVTRVAKKANKNGIVKSTDLTAFDLLIDGTKNEREEGVMEVAKRMIEANNFKFVMRSIARIIPVSNLMVSTKHKDADYLFTVSGGDVAGGVEIITRLDMVNWNTSSAELYCKAVICWLKKADVAGKKKMVLELAKLVVAGIEKKAAEKAAMRAALENKAA